MLKRGFTLIEILVVLGIIAILASSVVQTSSRARVNSKQKACIENLKMIQGATELYNSESDIALDEYKPKILLENKYLNNIPHCSAGGKYSLKDGIARCSVHGTIYEQTKMK